MTHTSPSSKSIKGTCYRLIQKVNFGDIDGMFDPNLDDYFLDRNYLQRILDKTRYFVIGRKGTGKSALYSWIRNRCLESGKLCSNITLSDFPFEKLLLLKDESFSRPYQYQTICKNMILNEWARLIVSDTSYPDTIKSDNYQILYDYVHNILGDDIDDCFRKTVQKAKKSNGSISISKINYEHNSEKNELFDYSDAELSNINRILQDAIVKHLISYPVEEKGKFVIQIDGLDENYNQIMTHSAQGNDYLQFLISLMKANYSLNQVMHQNCADLAKCIIYIRSDIFNTIHSFDAESARWEQYSEVLSWVVEGHKWLDNDLRRLINERISASLNFMNGRDGFSEIFDYRAIDLRSNNNILNKRIFEYIVNRSFHRPRDIIQFCIKIQEQVEEEGTLNFKTFNLAEREYSLWFLSEITNEISPKVKNVNELFSFLRTIGSKSVSISTFKAKYQKNGNKIDMDVDELLNYLYDTGIISNINDKGEWFSIIRNDKSRLNPDIKIILHPGFWKGLYASTF